MDGKTVSALGACFLFTACVCCAPCERSGDPTPEGPLTWTTLVDRTDLAARVERAKAAGVPTVVFVWADWCTYCRKYDEVIEQDPDLKAGFARMSRLRIDVNEDPRDDLRDGVGVPRHVQPYMSFLDSEGRIRADLTVNGWVKDAPEALARRLRALGVMEPR